MILCAVALPLLLRVLCAAGLYLLWFELIVLVICLFMHVELIVTGCCFGLAVLVSCCWFAVATCLMCCCVACALLLG